MAVMWASQVTSVALELALPTLLGYWLDRQWDTGPLFLLLGVLFGLVAFAAGMRHLLRMATQKNIKPARRGTGSDRPNVESPDGRRGDL